MLEFLKNWVIGLLALSIFIVLIEILLPSGKMKKFINLVTGFLIIFAVINPLIGQFNKKYDFNSIQTANTYTLDKNEIENNVKTMNESEKTQIVNLYKKKLQDRISQSASEAGSVNTESVQVEIDENYDSPEFGAIKKVYVSISPKTKSENSIVPQVEINVGKSNDKSNTLVDSQLEEKIKSKIGNEFDLQKENVIVSYTND